MRNKEIDIIRCILTIVVIAFHACCPYFTKTWALTSSMTEGSIGIYTYIGHALYNGMLEMFVMLSGFLYANTLNKKITISFCKKKLLRLYIPCLLWGCIYSILFLKDFCVKDIISGIGHLWFLPMLIWLFFIEYIVNKSYLLGLNEYHIFTILLLIAILPFPSLPLRLNNSLFYLLFFHCGVVISRNYNHTMYKIRTMTFWHLSFFMICCAIAIIAITGLDSAAPDQPLIQKMLLISRSHLIHGLGAIVALPLYWRLAIVISSKWTNQHQIILSLAQCSFGIYILQEFGLRILYYNTPFCAYFGDFSPILSVPIVFVASWLMTKIMVRYRATAFLIGS